MYVYFHYFFIHVFSQEAISTISATNIIQNNNQIYQDVTIQIESGSCNSFQCNTTIFVQSELIENITYAIELNVAWPYYTYVDARVVAFTPSWVTTTKIRSITVENEVSIVSDNIDVFLKDIVKPTSFLDLTNISRADEQGHQTNEDVPDTFYAAQSELSDNASIAAVTQSSNLDSLERLQNQSNAAASRRRMLRRRNMLEDVVGNDVNVSSFQSLLLDATSILEINAFCCQFGAAHRSVLNLRKALNANFSLNIDSIVSQTVLDCRVNNLVSISSRCFGLEKCVENEVAQSRYDVESKALQLFQKELVFLKAYNSKVLETFDEQTNFLELLSDEIDDLIANSALTIDQQNNIQDLFANYQSTFGALESQLLITQDSVQSLINSVSKTFNTNKQSISFLFEQLESFLDILNPLHSLMNVNMEAVAISNARNELYLRSIIEKSIATISVWDNLRSVLQQVYTKFRSKSTLILQIFKSIADMNKDGWIPQFTDPGQAPNTWFDDNGELERQYVKLTNWIFIDLQWNDNNEIALQKYIYTLWCDALYLTFSDGPVPQSINQLVDFFGPDNCEPQVNCTCWFRKTVYEALPADTILPGSLNQSAGAAINVTNSTLLTSANFNSNYSLVIPPTLEYALLLLWYDIPIIVPESLILQNLTEEGNDGDFIPNIGYLPYGNQTIMFKNSLFVNSDDSITTRGWEQLSSEIIRADVSFLSQFAQSRCGNGSSMLDYLLDVVCPTLSANQTLMELGLQQIQQKYYNLGKFGSQLEENSARVRVFALIQEVLGNISDVCVDYTNNFSLGFPYNILGKKSSMAIENSLWFYMKEPWFQNQSRCIESINQYDKSLVRTGSDFIHVPLSDDVIDRLNDVRSFAFLALSSIDKSLPQFRQIIDEVKFNTQGLFPSPIHFSSTVSRFQNTSDNNVKTSLERDRPALQAYRTQEASWLAFSPDQTPIHSLSQRRSRQFVDIGQDDTGGAQIVSMGIFKCSSCKPLPSRVSVAGYPACFDWACPMRVRALDRLTGDVRQWSRFENSNISTAPATPIGNNSDDIFFSNAFGSLGRDQGVSPYCYDVPQELLTMGPTFSARANSPVYFLEPLDEIRIDILELDQYTVNLINPNITSQTIQNGIQLFPDVVGPSVRRPILPLVEYLDPSQGLFRIPDAGISLGQWLQTLNINRDFSIESEKQISSLDRLCTSRKTVRKGGMCEIFEDYYMSWSRANERPEINKNQDVGPRFYPKQWSVQVSVRLGSDASNVIPQIGGGLRNSCPEKIALDIQSGFLSLLQITTFTSNNATIFVRSSLCERNNGVISANPLLIEELYIIPLSNFTPFTTKAYAINGCRAQKIDVVVQSSEYVCESFQFTGVSSLPTLNQTQSNVNLITTIKKSSLSTFIAQINDVITLELQNNFNLTEITILLNSVSDSQLFLDTYSNNSGIPRGDFEAIIDTLNSLKDNLTAGIQDQEFDIDDLAEESERRAQEYIRASNDSNIDLQLLLDDYANTLLLYEESILNLSLANQALRESNENVRNETDRLRSILNIFSSTPPGFDFAGFQFYVDLVPFINSSNYPDVEFFCNEMSWDFCGLRYGWGVFFVALTVYALTILVITMVYAFGTCKDIVQMRRYYSNRNKKVTKSKSSKRRSKRKT